MEAITNNTKQKTERTGVISVCCLFVSDSIRDVRLGVSSIYQQLSYQFYNVNFLMLVKY